MTQNVLAPSGSPQLIRWTKRTVLWLFLIAIALLSLFPIILVLLGSFKTNHELTGGATIWPKIWQFSNYAQAWKTANFSGFTINSVFVSISTTVGTLLVASMSAYAVDRVNFKGKKGYTLLMASTLFISIGAVVLRPQFDLMVKLGLNITLWGDGLDQTPYLSTQQWGEPEAQATTLRWESNDSYHFIDASQDGYTHLSDPVTHRRWMLAGVETHILLIVDWLEAEAEHTLEQRFHLHPQADIVLRINEAGEMTADMSYEASSITLTMQWVTAGIGKGAFALTEQPGWVSEVYGSKSETSVIQGKTDFSGKVGILTLCLPADHTDQVTRVTTCQLEPDRMRLALSYVQGEEKGYIVIDNETLQWTKEQK